MAINKIRKHVNGQLLPMKKRCTETQYINHVGRVEEARQIKNSKGRK